MSENAMKLAKKITKEYSGVPDPKPVQPETSPQIVEKQVNQPNQNLESDPRLEDRLSAFYNITQAVESVNMGDGEGATAFSLVAIAIALHESYRVLGEINHNLNEIRINTGRMSQ